MNRTTATTSIRAFLYGGAAVILAFNIFFLVRALFTGNLVPVLPIIVGILTAGGLLLIVFAESRSRIQSQKEARRISRVAHQLEAPLGSLEKDLNSLIATSGNLPAEARLKLKHMETKSKVLLENVRDVFLMLQAETKPLAQEVRTYDLCAILEEVVSQQRKVASATNVEIITKQHCETAPVKIDKHLALIALHHIIENAMLYTMKPGLVNVVVIKNGKKIRIVVQDRGIGLTDKDAEAIWLPFARGTRASEFDPNGIGVGLTLSRSIVEEFGGSLDWHPKETGVGSEFELILPLAK